VLSAYEARHPHGVIGPGLVVVAGAITDRRAVATGSLSGRCSTCCARPRLAEREYQLLIREDVAVISAPRNPAAVAIRSIPILFERPGFGSVIAARASIP
jgi:hypothetical protein